MVIWDLVSSEPVVEFEILAFDATAAGRKRVQLDFALSFLFPFCGTEGETQMKAIIDSKILGSARGRSEVRKELRMESKVKTNPNPRLCVRG